jgi:hypothetical protein
VGICGEWRAVWVGQDNVSALARVKAGMHGERAF